MQLACNVTPEPCCTRASMKAEAARGWFRREGTALIEDFETLNPFIDQ